MEKGSILPRNGGCWFCHKDDRYPIWLSNEFDTYIHLDCLKEAMKDTNDREAQIIGREFSKELEDIK